MEEMKLKLWDLAIGWVAKGLCKFEQNSGTEKYLENKSVGQGNKYGKLVVDFFQSVTLSHRLFYSCILATVGLKQKCSFKAPLIIYSPRLFELICNTAEQEDVPVYFHVFNDLKRLQTKFGSEVSTNHNVDMQQLKVD